MEKFIESQIEEARQFGRILGLIYIDLDKFKPINDTYGHHVGDLFLQEVAARMSRQLLGGDMLARLGGDEFAALVSLHHGRADLDTIVARLEHCFDDPFVVGGYLLHGEASIGFALYPEDGATTRQPAERRRRRHVRGKASQAPSRREAGLEPARCNARQDFLCQGEPLGAYCR